MPNQQMSSSVKVYYFFCFCFLPYRAGTSVPSSIRSSTPGPSALFRPAIYSFQTRPSKGIRRASTPSGLWRSDSDQPKWETLSTDAASAGDYFLSHACNHTCRRVLVCFFLCGGWGALWKALCWCRLTRWKPNHSNNGPLKFECNTVATKKLQQAHL